MKFTLRAAGAEGVLKREGVLIFNGMQAVSPEM